MDRRRQLSVPFLRLSVLFLGFSLTLIHVRTTTLWAPSICLAAQAPWSSPAALGSVRAGVSVPGSGCGCYSLVSGSSSGSD